MSHTSKRVGGEAPKPLQVQKFLVMQSLEQSPDQDYAGPVAVSREVGKLD